MISNRATSHVQRNMAVVQTQMRFFGVLPKLPKMELTVRTPYRTLFKDFNNFSRLYVQTTKGQMGIGNKSIPRVYLLPPGEFKVANYSKAEGSFVNNDSGIVIHTGGWLHVHE